MDSTAGQLVFVFVLIVINGYFAMAEIALISVRRSALLAKADEGSRGAQAALSLTADPTILLATIQIAITLVGMLASATAAVTLAQPVQVWLEQLGIDFITPFAAGVSVFLVTLIISYFTLVLGELVPKRLGLQKAEAVAVFAAPSIRTIATIFRPFVILLTSSTRLVGKLFGVDANVSQEGVSEEEIKLLVTEQGSLLDEEKQMISKIFEIGDTVAREIMVPRVDVTFIEDSLTVGEAIARMQQTGYSRIPVFSGDRDTIVGIAFLKDLVLPLSEGRSDDSIASHVRTPVFVPETKSALELMAEMQQNRSQFAIAVDEYGGTAGIVTIEDIVEEVVGEIADEFDRDKMSVSQIGDRLWVVDGTLPVEDAVDLGFPVEESEGYDTIAGWLLEKLGHIPHAGEQVDVDGWIFTAQSVRRRRVARIRIEGPVLEASEE